VSRFRWLAAALLLSSVPALSSAQPLPADLAAFRDLYKELVEINTTQSVGDCTAAANAMAARLKSGGFADADIHVIVPPGHPKRGNLVAVLHGTDPSQKGVMLLAHMDVVEAERADWQRDPFKFVEENGYFYSRGVADDKAMAAIFTDNMIRYKKQGYRPLRDIKLVLTCGEETPDDYNGVRYLLQNNRALIDAAFALNENGSGVLRQGKPIAITMQAGQKVRQQFQLEVSGPGGLSSAAPKETTITQMGRALARLAAYDFPLNISPSSRAYLAGMAPFETGQKAADMRALLAPTPDPAAAQRIRDTDPRLNAMIRTGCVAVRIAGGEADAAVPQRVTARLDCRMVPGESVDALEATLTRVIADPQIKLSRFGDPASPSPPPPLSEDVLGPAKKIAARMWPGIPLVPYQVNGEDDGRFLTPSGIPTYGLSGIFRDAEGDGTHGLNERIRVRSVYEGRDFLFDVVKEYAGGR
jgi:acetylornithine deacetylase/succinyl-diaminopimelate desuccinylase-like protein